MVGMARSQPTTDGESYPTTDGGDLDHEAALETMFGRQPTPRAPVYIDDGSEVVAITRQRSDDPSEADLTHVTLAVGRATRTIGIPTLWGEYVDDGFEVVERQFTPIETDAGDDGPTPSLTVDHETFPDHEFLDVRTDDGYVVNIDLRDGDRKVRVFSPDDDCIIGEFYL